MAAFLFRTLPLADGSRAPAEAKCVFPRAVAAAAATAGGEDERKARKKAEKRLKKVSKARARLIEMVHPREGEFPTLAEVDAFLIETEKQIVSLSRGKESKKQMEAVTLGPLIKVCAGKPCLQRGSSEAMTLLGSQFGDQTSVECSKCLGKCKEPGVTVEVQAHGQKTRGSWELDEMASRVASLLGREEGTKTSPTAVPSVSLEPLLSSTAE